MMIENKPICNTKPIMFLYISNKQPKIKIISSTIALKRTKYLGINLRNKIYIVKTTKYAKRNYRPK